MTWWHLQYFGMWMLGTCIGFSIAFLLVVIIGMFTRPYFEQQRSARQREKGVK